MSSEAVEDMLLEQGYVDPPVADLNALAFTTSQAALTAMLADTSTTVGLLVASLVQDAGRAAESVAVAARTGVQHTRMVNAPCCSRCAVLAGQTYRYSTGFLRHPHCDCVMVPTTVANPSWQFDPRDAMRRGQIRGLSKADQQAIEAGADFGQVVNVRQKSAGLARSGRVLSRADRPTPERIFDTARTQAEAQDLLQRFGYLR